MINFLKDTTSDNATEMVKILSNCLKEVTTSYMQELAKIEQKHWEQLQKQSSRQLDILEKQTKDFMSVMSDFIEASRPVQQPVIGPDLLDKTVRGENTIEKEEVEEHNLEDINRIPIVDGVNVQFDGEEEIHPINIS